MRLGRFRFALRLQRGRKPAILWLLYLADRGFDELPANDLAAVIEKVQTRLA